MGIAAILSLLLPTIPALIQGVEGIFGKGTGTQKMSIVESTALQLLKAVQGDKSLDATTLAQLQAILETLVAQNVGTSANPTPAPIVAGSNFTGSLNFKGGSLVSFG